MCRDERFKLGDGVRVASELEVELDPHLQRRQTQLLEPGDGGVCERLVLEIRERWPTPERKRFAQQRRRFRATPTLGRRGQPLEPSKVELVVVDAQQVSGRPCLDHVRTQQLAEVRHLPLHLRNRGHRRPPGVQLVGESIDGHDTVCLQEQERECRALPRASETRRAVVANHFERSEDAELEHDETVTRMSLG